MVLYALHRFNFPLKIEIVTNIIKFYSLFVHFLSVFHLSLQKYSFDLVRLATLLSSLIARRWVGLQTL